MVVRMRVAENVLRISKPGFDALTANALQLSFSEAMPGLIPATKGFITTTGTYALPETGYVPIIYVVGGANIGITVNLAAAVFIVSGTVSEPLRYIIFRNRQF